MLKKKQAAELQQLMDWVTRQVRGNDAPKFSDVVDYAHRVLKLQGLSPRTIRKELRLHPAYQMNAPQSLRKKRWNKRRPIIENMLGALHGDIGFFPLEPEFETPVTFRSGFLVCKDILSRFTYVSILKKTRDAKSMVSAFQDVFKQFEIQNKGLKVISLAFDKERSVMSKIVQNFLEKNKVKFFPFSNTSSKSKMAEGEIKIIRAAIRRLRFNKEQRWWRLLRPAVDSLNRQPIVVHNQYLKQPNGNYYTPSNVKPENLENFKQQLQKAVPAYFFNQFMLNPKLIKYAFKVGDLVRQKLVASSSAAIGEKRSDTALGNKIFQVVKLLAYVSKALSPEPLYLVENIKNPKEKEAFDEDEIALTRNE